jgi:hypothetical protein
LASSRDTSNRPDWTDVVRCMLTMHTGADQRVVMTLHPLGSPDRPRMSLNAQLVQDNDQETAPQVLGSASVFLPGNNFGDIETALLSLGYELDRDIYRRIEGIQPTGR